MRGDQRILYVEDDPDQMSLARHCLETNLPDVMVDCCATIAGAELLLNTACYDLIICDFCLQPAEVGTTIAEHVLSRDPDQPFYLMSEYIGDNVKAMAASVGLELHHKFSDVCKDEFLSRVRTMLAQRPCPDSSISSGLPVALNDSGDADSRESVSAGIDISADARATIEPAMSAGAARQNRRGEARRPSQAIRLTSPYLRAALSALGRG
jgi:CheY-like chemotaxis protein